MEYYSYLDQQDGNDPYGMSEIREGCSINGMSECGWSSHVAVESWSPCFNSGLIAIKIHEPYNNGKVKVSVIGADDTCMMQMFDSYEEAREVVKKLPVIIWKDYLLLIGFNYD